MSRAPAPARPRAGGATRLILKHEGMRRGWTFPEEAVIESGLFVGVVSMPRHASTVCFSSPLGLLEVESADTGVTRVRLGARGKPREVGDGDALECARSARSEILSYLDGDLKRFTVPVVLEGTPFQRAVWAQLLAIPYGKTRTYGDIAAELGKPRAARAVGTACGANPIPILVPCHRIVAGNGSLGGFGGGVRMKHDLLELERSRTS
jgi:O-6-methylguanine DNA methyltransferase